MNTIKILKTQTGYRVNGKPVYKDLNNNWVEIIPLTEKEKNELNKHLLSL